jgi:chromosomal replication initiation ATPase DnaA
MQTGSALRTLFAVILMSCFPSEPDELWNRFKHQICDDLRHVLETVLHFQNRNFTDDDVYDYGLYLLNKILIKSGKFLKNFPPMPLHQQHWEDQISDNELLHEQLDYDHAALQESVDRNSQSFNNEQCLAYNAAIDSVDNNLGKMLFIHSGGGGGKTFLCNTIAAKVRSEGHVALCVASSGIAALLLHQYNAILLNAT